jgi:uncharacterized membrane protein YqaE (UPF0057 family)
MKLIEIKFQGTTRTYQIKNKYDFHKQIKNTLGLIPSQYYITDGFHLLPSDFNFDGPQKQYYYLYIRMKGGLGTKSILGPIINPIKEIGNAVKNIGKFFVLLVKVFVWFGQFIKWLFTDFLNPKFWLVDIFKSIVTILRLLILGTIDAIAGFVRKMVNMVFGPITNAFWGWTPENDKQKGSSSSSSSCKGQKCYSQPDTRVPIPVLLGTIVLPPMGLFMELGLKGWMNILICAILTLAYYFPGLIYALIILYC